MFLSLEFPAFVEEIIAKKPIIPRKIIKIAEKINGGDSLINIDKKNQFQNVDMKEINIDEVLAMSLARGDLFIKTSSQKIYRLKRAGDFLDDEWKEKIKKHDHIFQHSFSNPDLVKSLTFRMKKWMDEEDPERFEIELKFLLKELQEQIHSNAKMFDLCICFFEVFKPDHSIIQQFQDSHVILYRRAHLVATLSCVFALSCGYHDPQFVRDLYQAAWVLDYGLVSPDFSYWVALACQAERVRAGGGEEFLRLKKAGTKEINLFLTHPLVSFEKAQASLKMKFPEILSSLTRHHEKSDGSGFPRSIPYSLISDWEALLVFSDQFVAYEEEDIEKQLNLSLRDLWKNVQSLPLELLPVQRVVLKIKKWFRTKVSLEVSV